MKNVKKFKFTFFLLFFTLLFTQISIKSVAQHSTTGPVRPDNVSTGIVREKSAGNVATVQTIDNVPTYIWRHGCGPTALGMVIGYYDLNGFPDLVVGDAGSQTTNVNNAVAGEQHYNDYSLPIDNGSNILQDKSELGGAHTSNCLADFMRTSWSSLNMAYGWSRLSDIAPSFTNYVNLVNPESLTSTELIYFSNSTSWSRYINEINNNRPVVFLVDSDSDGTTDHFVTGVGYDSEQMLYAVHDTWDHNIHWFNWRGMSAGNGWGIHSYVILNIESSVFHDYAVYNIESSNINPIAGEVVSVCAIIKNVGNQTEASGQNFYLYVDDVQTGSSQSISALAPEEEIEKCFNWTATAGIHKLEIKVALTGDENPDNDTDATTVFVEIDGNISVDLVSEVTNPACFGDLGIISGTYTVLGEGVTENGILLNGEPTAIIGTGSGTFDFTLEDVPAGMYELTAYAINNTSAEIDNNSVIVNSPDELSISTNTITTPTSATIICAVSGGTLPYLYKVFLNGLAASEWQNNNIFNIDGLQPSTQYNIEVLTIDANGCLVQYSENIITDADVCIDPLEPNNSFDSAFDIGIMTYYNDTALCLTSEDQDWFKFTYSGVEYYFMVKGYNTSTEGSYGIYFTRNDSIVQIETYETDGSTDTYLYLYDSDHASLLARNDDSNGLFSFIQYALPVPCTFEVANNSLVLPGSAGFDNSISILTNSDWYIEYDPDCWFSIDPLYGTGSSPINITYTANNTGSLRSDTIYTGSTCSNEVTFLVISQTPTNQSILIGNTTIYNTTSTASNRRAIPVTFNENGEINSISVYHNGGSGNMLLGVYSDVAGKPASRLGVTSSVAVNSTEGWQTVALSNPVSVSSGQKVWLSFVFQNSVAVRYEAGTPGRAMSSQTWSAGMPDNFGTSGVSNYNFSVYCNYTPVEINEKPLGNSTVYNSTSTASNRRAIPVTFNENGEINSISVYHNGGTGNMLLGIYADVAGKPAAKLGVTSSVTVNAAEGWQTVALANPVSVSSGQKVWLSFVFQNSVAVRYEAGTPGRAMSSQTWSAGMPDEFGISGVSNYNFSVYCSYTPVEITEKPLGNTVVYSTTSTAANRRAIPVTFNENGEINSISVYHNGGSGNMLLGVYADVAGKPASRLGVTSSVAVNVAEGWQTVTLASPVSVSSGQKVWLSFVFQNSVAVRYEAGTPGRAMSSQTWSAGMPDEFGASGVSNYNFSVYCNYTPVEVTEKPLGHTVVYGTTSTAANRRAIPVTFNENGEINSISVYHNGGTGNLLLGVYTDVAGKPASRLGVTSLVAVNAAEGWQTVALASPVSVSSGQKVWLSFVFQNSVAVRYEAGTPGRAMSSQTWSAGMPDKFGTSGVSNYNFSVYCNYTPASSGLLKDGQFDNMVTETIENPIGEANELKVYPNPFSQKLNFEFVSAENANAILEIYNLNGQLITKLLDQPVQGGVLNRIEYTPNEIISGMYIYKLNLDGDITVGKVVYRK